MSAKYSSARPVNIFFALCLGVSIGLHIVSALMVVYIWTDPADSGRISYLEMSDLVPAPTASPPATLSTRIREQKPAVQTLPEPVPVPVQESPAESEENVSERIANEDIRTTPLGLGMAYGFVSSLGEGATLREDIREYYLVLVEKINKVWWERAGTLSDVIGQDGIAVIAVKRDGTIIDRVIRRGTGSPEVDQALLDSIDKAAPLPPLPASYGQEVFTAPLKITAPSRLLRATTY
ncbi:MAG: TonB C-terminal domain-containing protein [Steroidobacteraceae bacterium]|nr:TonB C-terminal domain-containing protein [Deltaproteobacteria bacterium]